MGIVKRESSLSAIINYVGVLIGYCNVALLMPWYMDPKDLGLRSTLIGFTSLLAHLAQLGITQTFVRYFPYYKDDPKKKREFILFVFLVPLVPLLLILGFVSIKSDWIAEIYIKSAPDFIDYFYLVFPLTFIVLYQAILEFYARVLKKTVVITIIREILMKGSFAVLVLFYGFKVIPLEYFWDIYIGTFFLASLVLIIYLLSLKELKFQFSFSFLTKEKAKEITSYSLFGYLSGFSGAIVNSIDVIMISAYINISYTGIYAIGVFMATLIDIPRKSISQISISLVSEASKMNDLVKLKDLYCKTSLNQTIIGLGLFLVIWLNIDQLFILIPNYEKYLSAKYVVFFICIGRLVNMIAGANGEIIQYSKYYRFNLYSISILGMLAYFTNYFMIYSFGDYARVNGYSNEIVMEYQIIGVAIATAFSVTTFNILRTIFLFVRMKMHPFSIQTVKVIVWFGVTFLVVVFIPLELKVFSSNLLNAIGSMVIRTLLIASVYGWGVIYFKFSEDINKLAYNIYRKVFFK